MSGWWEIDMPNLYSFILELDSRLMKKKFNEDRMRQERINQLRAIQKCESCTNVLCTLGGSCLGYAAGSSLGLPVLGSLSTGLAGGAGGYFLSKAFKEKTDGTKRKSRRIKTFRKRSNRK